MWVIGLLSVAMAEDCAKTSVGKLAAVPQPAVLVLGERKGTLPDLKRAKAIVAKLAKRGPVTVALQAVAVEHQPVLDEVNAGKLSVDQLPSTLDWENTWGFPFEAYEPLFALAGPGVKLVAAGQRYEPLPEEVTLPLPPGYMHVLADTMVESPLPVELESSFVAEVAWADHRMAKSALAGWDGKGALVIVVDRFHVQGGLGVGWQAQRMTDAPVTAALLAAAEGICYAGDQTLP